MKLHLNLFILLTIMYVNTTLAQTTAIPDQNFEQALIDLNIDSDGVINGQVLTSDIDDLIELDFENVPINDDITDLTGIEDFAALEILDFHYFYLDLDPSQADILSNNINLREFIAMNPCGDCGGVALQVLDLSGLPNLELVDLTNVYIKKLVIDNPNFDIQNLTLDLYNEGPPSNGWTQHICIEVADPQVASNDQPPYDSWNIIVNDLKATYSFDNICTLSVDEIDNRNSLSVYPNPVKDKLRFENPDHINIDKAEVYDISGQKLKTFSSVDEHIDLESLGSGVYFVMIHHKGNSSTFRVLKK